jgi:hypothetical protein
MCALYVHQYQRGLRYQAPCCLTLTRLLPCVLVRVRVCVWVWVCSCVYVRVCVCFCVHKQSSKHLYWIDRWSLGRGAANCTPFSFAAISSHHSYTHSISQQPTKTTTTNQQPTNQRIQRSPQSAQCVRVRCTAAGHLDGGGACAPGRRRREPAGQRQCSRRSSPCEGCRQDAAHAGAKAAGLASVQARGGGEQMKPCSENVPLAF